jgi:hypothetical protein
MTPDPSILPGLHSISNHLGQHNGCAAAKAGYAFYTCRGKPLGQNCWHKAFVNPTQPSGMAVGLIGGIKVTILVWTCIVTLDDRYIASIVATYPNQGFKFWENKI